MKKNGTGEKILVYSGALIAFHVGSGFASGQEILQFFTAYGFWQGTLAMVLAWLLFMGGAAFLLTSSFYRQEKKEKDCWQTLCGCATAGVFRFITPVFLFLTYVVMLAGTGALFSEYYHLPSLYGRLLMSLLSLITVMLGMKRLLDIVGGIGPVIILFVVLLGAAGVFLPAAPVDPSLCGLLPKAAPTAPLSALLYGGFSMVTGTVFLYGMSGSMKSKKQAVKVAVLGNTVFMLAAFMLHLGLYRNLNEITGKQIPALVLAGQFSGWFGAVFSFVLFLGIYTTAVPMLWSVAESFSGKGSGGKRRLAILILGAFALALSGYSFDALLGLIYPAIGVCGVFLLCGMLWNRWKLLMGRGILKTNKKKNGEKYGCEKHAGRLLSER